jgi:hypothetical protein
MESIEVIQSIVMAGRKSRPPMNTLPAMAAQPRGHTTLGVLGSPALTAGDDGMWG